MKFNFAHLMGASKKPKAAKNKRAEENPDDPNKPDNGAEDNEPDPNDTEEDTEDDPNDPGEGGDDTDTEDDEDNPDNKPQDAATKAAVAKARTAERNRCASIFASKHAAGRTATAAELAFNTNLTAEAAINVLKATPADGKASGLASAMSSVRNPQIGDEAGDTRPNAGGFGSGKSLVANAKKRAEAAKSRRG